MNTLTQTVDEPLSRTLTFRVTETFWKRVGVVARNHSTSIQALCTEAIERKLDELEQAEEAA